MSCAFGCTCLLDAILQRKQKKIPHFIAPDKVWDTAGTRRHPYKTTQKIGRGIKDTTEKEQLSPALGLAKRVPRLAEGLLLERKQ